MTQIPGVVSSFPPTTSAIWAGICLPSGDYSCQVIVVMVSMATEAGPLHAVWSAIRLAIDRKSTVMDLEVRMFCTYSAWSLAGFGSTWPRRRPFMGI